MEEPRTDEGLRRWRNTMACLGLGAIAAFVVALVLLHAVAGRDSPGHMSEFANSRFGLLWALSVYTIVLGGAMVVWVLKPCLHDCPSKWIGIAMLWLAGAAAVLLAAFPTDDTYVRTLSGRVHNDAAVTTFALLGGAMVVLAPAFRASPSLGRFAPVSVLLGTLVTASWVTYLVTTLERIHVYGPVQRVLVALIAAWFVLLALRLRRADPAVRRTRLRTIVLVASTATPMPEPDPEPEGPARQPRKQRKRKPARKAGGASQPMAPSLGSVAPAGLARRQGARRPQRA